MSILKIVFQVLFITLTMTRMADAQLAGTDPVTPAMFVFGDSLLDPGNNNYILTIAKSDWYPNGIDYPGGATGRFCNGRTAADVVLQLMNLPPLPAYLAPSTTGTAILNGVNYASAAGGILDSTGVNFIGRISMNQQIQYFENTQQQFRQLIPDTADQVFAKGIYYVAMGNNDYINNYLLPISPTAPQYNPQQFQDLLISTLHGQITSIYNLGARKFAVFNIGPTGCIPQQLTQQNSPDGSCAGFENEYIQGFNAALQNLVDTLPSELPGSFFILGNIYDQIIDKINYPSKYGLTTVNEACCGIGPNYKGLIPCIPFLEPCPNRDEYLFWDPYHPTDAVNFQLGNAFFAGSPAEISPINLQQLVALEL